MAKTLGYEASFQRFLADNKLHAEPCSRDRFDRVRGPDELDSGRPLTTEDIEQQLAREADDANCGFPSPGSYGVGCPSPLEREPRTVQSPSEEPWCTTDVAP